MSDPVLKIGIEQSASYHIRSIVSDALRLSICGEPGVTPHNLVDAAHRGMKAVVDLGVVRSYSVTDATSAGVDPDTGHVRAAVFCATYELPWGLPDCVRIRVHPSTAGGAS